MFERSYNKADRKLLTAAAQGSVAEVLLQLSHSANINCRDAKTGRTPLWLACDAGHADEVQVLLRAGAEVDAKSFPHEKYQVLMGGSTALHQAAMHGHASVVQSLLEYGADPNSRTADGDSPLMCAASDGHAEVVKQLLSHGADTAASNKGRTALEAAMYWKKQEVANILLDHQVRLQARARGKVLPRIYSLPQEARTSEAPIYRSCSDTKAEQDKWHLLHTHESPKKAAAQKPAPASSCMSAKAHTSGPVLERSSSQQAAKTVHMGNLQLRSVPDKGAGSEGKVGVPSKAHTVPGNGARSEGKAGVPFEAHMQHPSSEESSGKYASRAIHMAQPRSIPEPATKSRGKAEAECSYAPMSDCSSGKQAGRAMHLAMPQSKSVPDKATRMGGSPTQVCYHVPTKAHTQDSECEHSSGKQASNMKAVNMATPHSTFEGKATKCEPNRAARCEGKAELVCDAMSDSTEAADWQMLGAQLAPATYSFYSTDVTAVVEDASLGVAGILWEVFQQFSAVGQELASSAAFVPGLYLVAVGLKLLGYVMRTNASADELTQRLYRVACSIVNWVDSLLPKAAKDDAILLRLEKLLTPLAFVLRDVKSFVEKQPGAWAPSRIFTAGSRQATARTLQDKLEEFLKELQLAGFVVNMDTRQQVQKLQQEVMQCTHELSTLQDHLKTGFAEVKDKIDDSQDRMQAQLGRVLQEVQWLGLRLDPKTEAKSEELMHEAEHMDPVQQQKLLATVLWEAQEALDKHAATRHHAEVLQRTADDNGWDRCGICCEALALEGHMKPRFLPCQHVLCSSCLVQCCSDGLVSCPWCREVHRPKFLVAVDGDITCAADGFPAPLMQMQYLENHFKYARVLQA